MSQDLRISPKERLVLTAIMETYIATGEPVASQAIARQFKDKEGLSAATIRNVMSSLGEAGFLDQPHTSAGRIPTGKAFRFYVEQLAGQSRPAASILTQAQQDRIEDSFAGVSSSQQFLERTSHVLALVSSGVGLALASASEVHLLEHIHFSRLSLGRVLAVVVTKAGLVLDRVLGLERDLSHTELEMAARYLNENYHGWSVERIREEVKQRIEIERGEYDHLMRLLQELWSKSLMASEMSVQTIFVEGVANLLATELDRDRLRQMLSALEAKQRLIELLNAYVDARQQSVRVVVGLEETMPEMSNLVLIGAPTRLGIDSLGTVAVLAPTRIQYQETISAVSFIAQLSERILQVPQ
jgi:heat-inducible transcriptional repressor